MPRTDRHVSVRCAVDDFEVPGGELVERDPPFIRIEESLVGVRATRSGSLLVFL
jgi:hypothetical protein